MYKNPLLILIAFLLLTDLSGQNCEYEEYNKLIEIANLNYSNKKYKEVNKTLKEAFLKTDFPLGEDLHLALKIARKTKDSEWAEKIAIQLAKGGVPLRYFTKNRDFKWYEKFKTDFEDYAIYFDKNFDSKLRVKLLSLLKQDIDSNKKYHQWRTREIEMTLQELVDGASSVVNNFKLLTDEYGIPSEQKMGYNYNRAKNIVEYYTIEVLFIHIYLRGELIFKEDLQQIACRGIFHPNNVETLKNMTGFGNSTGVEQEMKARYLKYRGNK